MTRDIKVTLAGDADVGKSSLVTALVRDSWSSSVQRVVPEILLPADVTETGVSTRIVDTASSPAQRSHLESSLRSSHVIILVYSIEAPASFDRIPTYWLPYIRSLGINVPVILVGNKIDLRTEAMLNTNEALEDELAPVMAEFKEVESCIETSVKEGINVSEVFYFAQKVSG
jgi:Ras family protein T1